MEFFFGVGVGVGGTVSHQSILGDYSVLRAHSHPHSEDHVGLVIKPRPLACEACANPFKPLH